MSSPPATVAALPGDSVQAGGGIEGVAVRALDALRAGGPLGELPCAPPAPRLHARFSEPRKRQQPWWPTRARPSAQMAAPAAPASVDAPRHLSGPPFSRQRPQPSPTVTLFRYGKSGWRDRWSSELPHLPVQRRRVTTTLPRATRMQLNHQSAKPSRSPAIGPLTHLVEERYRLATNPFSYSAMSREQLSH